MAIPLSGQFTYRAVMNRSSDGTWRSRAERGTEKGLHPGLAGEQPHVELADGVLRFRKSDRVLSFWKRHGRDWGPTATEIAFEVGRLADAIEEGDVLLASRGGTTDLG